MKHLVPIIMALILAFALAGFAGCKKPAPPSEQAPAAPAVPSNAPAATNAPGAANAPGQ